MYKHITSPFNAVIRHAEQLMRKSRERRKQGLFIVEGRREIRLCISGKYELEKLLVCPEIFGLEADDERLASRLQEVLAIDQLPEINSLSPDVFEKLAYRGSVEGVIAFAKVKPHTLNDLPLSRNPLLLIAESPEKPGNLGAILRTADAAGIDAVIVTNAKTDLYNPNVLRSSLGCAMTVPVAICSTMECIEFCKGKGIEIFASTLQSSQRYDRVDYTRPTAIAMGTEATGISEEFRKAATANVIIPMHGVIDSMNLSASAAILIYEAVKQRGFK